MATTKCAIFREKNEFQLTFGMAFSLSSATEQYNLISEPWVKTWVAGLEIVQQLQALIVLAVNFSSISGSYTGRLTAT